MFSRLRKSTGGLEDGFAVLGLMHCLLLVTAMKVIDDLDVNEVLEVHCENVRANIPHLLANRGTIPQGPVH
jgi:hypothetical protein